jgi:hypothetical protein
MPLGDGKDRTGEFQDEQDAISLNMNTHVNFDYSVNELRCSHCV